MLDHTSSSSSTLCLKTSTPATSWARVCDTCRSAPSSLYCRPDAAFLCTGCDARIHSSNVKHERVWVCEACEQAPAAFICKADAASLCATCDKDIHSANPLARRHHRVPVMPILMYGTMAVGGVESQQSGFMSNDGEDEDESEAASWLLFDGPPVPVKNSNSSKEGGFLYGEAGGATEEEYMEFMEFGGGDDDEQQQQQCCYTKKMYSGGDADSVVPTQHHHDFQNHKFRLGMEFDNSNAAGYNGYPPPTTHSVSLDVGVVPESTRSEGSLSHPRPSKGTIDLFSNSPVQVATQLTPMDREARVLRYRQKKKTRKFEKTIRYASRKAYAETRPRIKGRFAKRTNADVDMDQMFPTNHMIEGGYGIVPSF